MSPRTSPTNAVPPRRRCWQGRTFAGGIVLAMATAWLACPAVAQQYVPAYATGTYATQSGYGSPYPNGAAPLESPAYYPASEQPPYGALSPAEAAPAPAQPYLDSWQVPDGPQAPYQPGCPAWGAPCGSTRVVPEMLGDRFGTAGTRVRMLSGSGTSEYLLPGSSMGGVVGRLKLAENTSPLPRDRIFFNYTYFDDTPLLSEGVNVNRYTLGVEKTFFDGALSLEVKAPVGCTLEPDITLARVNDSSNYVFGNLYTTVKLLVARGDEAALSTGITVEVPTADGISILNASGDTLIAWDNDSTYLAPFLGAIWEPRDSRLFVQGFVQWDVDATGSPVSVNASLLAPSSTLIEAGEITDATWQYNDLSLGYWIVDSSDPCAVLNSLAVIAEVHYNVALCDEEELTATIPSEGSYTIGQRARRDNLNVTVGMAARFSETLMLGAGYTCPIGNAADQESDGELRVYLNYYFGRTGRDSASLLD